MLERVLRERLDDDLEGLGPLGLGLLGIDAEGLEGVEVV